MQNRKYIVCGDAATSGGQSADDTIRLHLHGPDDEAKVTLRIDDIRKWMFKEIPPRFNDLLEIATYVFAADQMIQRGADDVDTFGNNWRRNLHFTVPVRDPGFWSSGDVTQQLRATLGFLSDDHYEFEFVAIEESTALQGLLNFNEDGEMLGKPEQVIMFSGGLDSLGGAIEEIVNQRRRVILVNHRTTQKLDKWYKELCEKLNEKAPGNAPIHIRVTACKQKWMNKEHTQRTRSFLFMSLGATIANMMNQSNIRFYENGIISMNLPICAQVVGGKATRTTHPRVLDGFQKLLTMVAGHQFSVENPFIWKTKTEVVSLIANAGCDDLIGPSVSCTHTWERTKQFSHCGACSQCIDRRFAVLAADQENHDPLDQYKVDVFTESRTQVDHIHEDKTLIASYLERANQVSRFDSATQFLARYAEVARVFPYLNGVAGANAQRCFDMYKKHSAEINGVVDKMFSRHGSAIRQRTLPADSLMRIVYESNLPTSVSAVPTQDVLPDNVFRRKGGAWEVRFNGQKPLTVLPWLGASYIHYLLIAQGKKSPAIKIVGSSAADYCERAVSVHEAIEAGLQSVSNPLYSDLGKISDWQAVNEYRTEVRGILADLDQARAGNKDVLVKQYENDLVMILSKINESVGFGGKLKSAPDKRKNISDTFRTNVKRLIEKQIQGSDPALAAHLLDSISFGYTPSYSPKSPITWELQEPQNFLP